VILPLDTARLWFNQAARPRNFFDVNQVWLDLPEREASETLARDLESTEGINRVVYAYDRYGQILREPLPSAIAGMLFAGFWISLALSLLDFAFYIAVTAQQRSFTFGVLRSLGWNANNIWRLLLVEQITLVTPALIIGSILGAALAYLILPFLSLVGNETLRLPVGDVGSLIASLIVAFSILLVFAAFFLRRMSVNQVLRLGEE
jgi:ABC-type antimicrobial peptide transport system permease subunit